RVARRARAHSGRLRARARARALARRLTVPAPTPAEPAPPLRRLRRAYVSGPAVLHVALGDVERLAARRLARPGDPARNRLHHHQVRHDALALVARLV